MNLLVHKRPATAKLMLIASKHIPMLRRLISAALMRGLSAERIVELINKLIAYVLKRFLIVLLSRLYFATHHDA